MPKNYKETVFKPVQGKLEDAIQSIYDSHNIEMGINQDGDNIRRSTDESGQKHFTVPLVKEEILISDNDNVRQRPPSGV